MEVNCIYLSRGLKDRAFAITKHNTEDLPPAIKLRHTKLMILHAAIVSNNGANKIIVNSLDGDTVFVN